jgi:hypothetical protein
MKIIIYDTWRGRFLYALRFLNLKEKIKFQPFSKKKLMLFKRDFQLSCFKNLKQESHFPL